MLKHKTFVYTFIGIVSLLLTLTFATNLYVDPLWYFGGNKISGKNSYYNARISKTVLYTQSDKNYDCIIFGSSTTLYLHASEFKNYNCFNFATSGGNVMESIRIAEYIKKIGKPPSLVIMGLDAFIFKNKQGFSPQALPEEILKQVPLIPFWKRYISINTFIFSLADLLQIKEYHAQYDVITGQTDPGIAKPYTPSNIITNRRNMSPNWHYGTLYKDNIAYYKRLREIFPSAKFVGYIPHKSLWDVARIEFLGGTENTLEIMYATSKVFDQFYDFSLPSETVADTSDTVDGFHYGMKTLINVVKAVEDNKVIDGLSLHHMTFEEYSSTYKKALHKFIALYNLQPAEDLTLMTASTPHTD